jgi:hypothetical protein
MMKALGKQFSSHLDSTTPRGSESAVEPSIPSAQSAVRQQRWNVDFDLSDTPIEVCFGATNRRACEVFKPVILTGIDFSTRAN